MKMLKALILFIISMSLSPILNAGELTELLKNRDAQIKANLPPEEEDPKGKQKAKLKELINGFIDFDTLGRNALKTHWPKLKQKQRVEFIDLFRFLIRENSVKKLKHYRSENVEYLEEEIKKEEGFVNTLVEGEEEEADINYIFKKNAKGWQVIDVVIDEVSTEKNYRGKFNKIVKKKGIEGLLKKLRKKKKKLLKKDKK